MAFGADSAVQGSSLLPEAAFDRTTQQRPSVVPRRDAAESDSDSDPPAPLSYARARASAEHIRADQRSHSARPDSAHTRRPAASTSRDGRAPTSSAPLVDSTEKMHIRISAPDGASCAFKVRSTYSVLKVLLTACRTYGLKPEQFVLVLCYIVRATGSDLPTRYKQTPPGARNERSGRRRAAAVCLRAGGYYGKRWRWRRVAVCDCLA